jgi:hypothetical protein
MGYPIVWANPQRPAAQFTLQDNEGRYLTPTGDYISADALRTYVFSGFSSLPSAADVKTAQAALGLPETGDITDFDTLAGIVNAQIAAGLTTTGVPDSATLAAIRSMLNAGQSPTAGNNKKKKKDNSGEITTLAILAVVLMVFFRGD